MISFEPDNASINKIFQDNFFSMSSKIFSNEEVLSPTHIPEILPHRKDEIKYFGSCFKNIVTTGHAKQDFSHLIIQGENGTGKTTLTKVCMLHLTTIAQKYHVQLRYIHVNCRSAKSVFLMVNTILQVLDPLVPVRGFSPTELLLHFFNRLKHSPFHLVVTFDELDAILESHDPKEFARFLEVLTGLFEAPQDVKEKFSLIFILRRFDFLFRLDILKRTFIQRNVIQLSAYTQDQLADILQERIQNVFYPQTASTWLAPILASLIEYLHLDIRAGLNLLANVGREAESCETEVITGDHLSEVLFRMYDWESAFAGFSHIFGSFLHQYRYFR